MDKSINIHFNIYNINLYLNIINNFKFHQLFIYTHFNLNKNFLYKYNID